MRFHHKPEEGASKLVPPQNSAAPKNNPSWIQVTLYGLFLQYLSFPFPLKTTAEALETRVLLVAFPRLLSASLRQLYKRLHLIDKVKPAFSVVEGWIKMHSEVAVVILFSYSTMEVKYVELHVEVHVMVSRKTVLFCFLNWKNDLTVLTCKIPFFLSIKYSKATQCHYQSHNYYSSDDTTYVKVICNYKR